jgi:putative addiction module component (TIGR02574 family)
MVRNHDDVFEAAMKLPEADRAELAERLLETLDQARRQEIDAAWADEAERRLTALDHGEVPAVAGEQVMRTLAAGKRP